MASPVRIGAALRDDANLWCWGANDSGQLRMGDRTSRAVPTQVGTASGWGNLTLGSDITMAIRADGTLWAWGLSETWTLGLGSNADALEPTQVPGLRARLVRSVPTWH